jgi:hypothetical protein
MTIFFEDVKRQRTGQAGKWADGVRQGRGKTVQRASEAGQQAEGSVQRTVHTLIKKKIKFSSYIRKFGMEQLQSHIWLKAFSYMTKYLRISSDIRKPFLIYDFEKATEFPYIWGKFAFLFYQCSVHCTVSRSCTASKRLCSEKTR